MDNMDNLKEYDYGTDGTDATPTPATTATNEEQWEARHEHIMIRTTVAERQAIRLAAYKDGRSTSSYCRWTLLNAITKGK